MAAVTFSHSERWGLCRIGFQPVWSHTDRLEAYPTQPGLSPGSVIKHKLPAIEQGPENVLQSLLSILVRRQAGQQLLLLLGRRLPSQAADIQLVHDLFRRVLGLQAAANEVAGLDFLRGIFAVEQVQRLRQRRLQLHLAGADRLASGSTKSGEEIVAIVAVGNLHRPSTQRQTSKLILGIGHLRDAIEEHLGLDAPDEGV